MKTLWLLPGSSTPTSSHFKADKCAGEEEQDHVAEFGEGNQNQQYLAAYNVGDHHWLIWAELMESQKPCQKGQGGENQ